MSKDTGISWTDHTFNPWWGCTAVSAGCDHCYAEAFDNRMGGDHWGKGKPRRTFGDAHWREPIAWNEAAKKAGPQAKEEADYDRIEAELFKQFSKPLKPTAPTPEKADPAAAKPEEKAHAKS